MVATNVNVDKVKACLLGSYIGDALAMPVHWYYDTNRLKEDFGYITTYEAPKETFPGSYMNLSNTGGGGRGSDEGDIIGRVINHGKHKYWLRDGQYHYHHGMSPGQNTLDMLVSRELLCSMTETSKYDAEEYRNRYVRFMTTPGSHNDTYAGTCHRVFFKNFDEGLPPEKCPGNDGHNVDCSDALTGLIPVILASLARGHSDEELRKELDSCINVTRKSTEIVNFAIIYAHILLGVLQDKDLRHEIQEGGKQLSLDVAKSAMNDKDPTTACYLPSSFPALLHYAYKYADKPKEALIASTNAGGENVARGALLGALMGAVHGPSAFPDQWQEGLADEANIRKDIDRFVGVFWPSKERAADRNEDEAEASQSKKSKIVA